MDPNRPSKTSPLASLRGLETVGQSGRGGWPGDEFLHPLPLGAMAVLAVNDHWLKGSGVVPGWLTGKLSDFAGLVFFPLFLTALLNTVLFFVFRLFRSVTVNYSFTRAKLVSGLGITALLFVPLQLSARWASAWETVLGRLDVLNLFSGFSVTPDPTDLLALSVFPLVYWHGLGTLRRVPVGRLAVLRRRMERALRTGRGDPERLFEKGTVDLKAVCRSEGAEQALRRLGVQFTAYVRTGESAREREAEESLAEFRRAAR